MWGKRLTRLLACLFAATVTTAARQAVFAAVDGSPDAPGTLTHPTSLQTGISRLGRGVTLWLRGGRYSVNSGITISRGGTPDEPAVIRNYNGERVAIEGGAGQAAVIFVAADYVWIWGLDIFSSAPRRISREPGAFPSDIGRLTAVATAQTPQGGGRGLRLINCIVRDGFNGIGLWKEAVDAEIYGTLIFNNGWEGADKGWNHGIYTQNRTGTKVLMDNIVFNQFSHGIHAYGSENSYLDNFHIEGNILFNNGGLSVNEGYAKNLLLGGGRVAQNARIIDNYTYYPLTARDGSNNIGYEAGCNNLVAQGNHFVGPVALRMIKCSNATFSGNLLYGEITGFRRAQYPGNTYVTQRPVTNYIFVRPNKYEPGRANIVVYNWKSRSTVAVNPGSVLKDGDKYEVIDAQNYFGPAIATGTYYGGEIVIPMTSTAVTQPVGKGPIPAAHTGVEFGAFILRRAGKASEPPPPPPTLTISGVTMSGITANSVAISWTTSVAANGQVEYGTSTAYGKVSALDSSMRTARSITLTGLNPSTRYYFRVRSRNAAGNIAVSAGFSFQTRTGSAGSQASNGYIEAEPLVSRAR